MPLGSAIPNVYDTSAKATKIFLVYCCFRNSIPYVSFSENRFYRIPPGPLPFNGDLSGRNYALKKKNAFTVPYVQFFKQSHISMGYGSQPFAIPGMSCQLEDCNPERHINSDINGLEKGRMQRTMCSCLKIKLFANFPEKNEISR